jgi:peptide/nickel transport system permease protein
MDNRPSISNNQNVILKKKRQNGLRIFWRRFKKQKAAFFCLILVSIIILICGIAPFIAPYNYQDIDGKNIANMSSVSHWFGTDDLGRDIFSRILYGGRYSLAIGVLATIISLFAGIVLGGISGFFGGWIDNLIMRFFDVLQAIPGILLSITVATVMGPGFFNMLMALAVSAVAGYARILRAQILSIRNVEFVEAAISINCSIPRILANHVIPNAITPVIVQATMGIAQQILSAATLAYVGLGIQPPTPEWGAMLNSARVFIRKAPHMLIFPGIMIVITVLCFNIIGDGARDALDPKLKS